MVTTGCRTRMGLVRCYCFAPLLSVADRPCSDTMDTLNVNLTNFMYQGGDDCVAIKPRTYNFHGHNIVCISYLKIDVVS